MMKAKRFWKNVSVVENDGFRIMLDDRELKTPYRSTLNLPTRALADVVAKEWESVDGEINPDQMPMTRMSNSAVEQVAAKREGVENHILEYVDFDLLSYRSEEPAALVEKQKAWDVWLEWAKQKGVHLHVTSGILPIDQPAENQMVAKNWIGQLSNYELVSFYEFVTLTGSFTLAMAIFEGALGIDEGFDLSRIDEDFQAEIWGAVDVKLEEREKKYLAISESGNFLALVRAK